MRFLAGLILVGLLAITPAVAAPQTAQMAQAAQAGPSTPDEPIGAPYRVGETNNAQVPLRDFLSSRIDSLRTEILDRMDERDRRYGVEFNALRNKLLDDVQSVKDTSSAALASASIAVNKAEAATKERLDLQNEFRGTLEDSNKTYAPKAEMESRFKGLDESITRRFETLEKVTVSNSSRLDAITSRGEGQSGVIAAIGIGLGILIAAGGLFLNFSRRPQRLP